MIILANIAVRSLANIYQSHPIAKRRGLGTSKGSGEMSSIDLEQMHVI